MMFSNVLILAAQLPGTSQDHIEIFNLEDKFTKLKSRQMSEQVSSSEIFLYHFNYKVIHIVYKAKTFITNLF